MFSLRVRIWLAVLAAVYGTYRIVTGNESAYMLLIVAALLAFGYFRYGAIRPAFMAMRRDDLKTARKHFATIKFPNLLSPQSRAYYHWVNAILTLEDTGDTDFAVSQLQLAIDGRLRTSHDRCIATAMLAHILAKGGDLPEALRMLDEAEQIPHRASASAYLHKVRSDLQQPA